jgi:hypothetical protein
MTIFEAYFNFGDFPIFSPNMSGPDPTEAETPEASKASGAEARRAMEVADRFLMFFFLPAVI